MRVTSDEVPIVRARMSFANRHHELEPQVAAARPRRFRLDGVFKDVVLAFAALLGICAVSWLVYTHQSGATVIVLKTGSMAPTIPQGSGAISKPVPASALAVGDIVTVRLDDASPLVTHRIRSIATVPGEPAMRSLILQGDANKTPDMFAYKVTQALKVSVTIPRAGYVMRALRTPIFLGAVVLTVGLLMLWAFWPAPLEDIEQELLAHGKHR